MYQIGNKINSEKGGIIMLDELKKVSEDYKVAEERLWENVRHLSKLMADCLPESVGELPYGYYVSSLGSIHNYDDVWVGANVDVAREFAHDICNGRLLEVLCENIRNSGVEINEKARILEQMLDVTKG